MSLTLNEIFASENEIYRTLGKNISTSIHVCLPCVVQSYNPQKRTVEVQPLIREKVTNQQGIISYVEYPLLINVPVVFPQAGNFVISFPIQKGDECIVIFSDLSYDFWWEKGNVQNPVELRRHDLSDGLAIFGIKNQMKQANDSGASSSNLKLYNSSTGTAIEVMDSDIRFTYSGGQITMSQIVSRLNPEE